MSMRLSSTIAGPDRRSGSPATGGLTSGTSSAISIEAVAWQAGVQLVSHRAVEVSQVNAAGRAELVEVESGVAALQGVESPCDQIDSLGQDDLALLQFQRVTDAAVAVTGQRSRDVRAMLHAAVRRQADEAEDESDHPLFAFNNVERADHHAAVLMRRHQSLESDDLDVLHSPDFALEPFDGMVFVFCFDRSNLDSHPSVSQRENIAGDESNGREGETGRRRDGGTAWINKVRLRLSFYRLVTPSPRRPVAPFLRLNADDQDFVDAATIHVHHLDSQTVPDEV